METLEEKILKVLERERELVKRPPKNDSERGFQLAVLRLCAIIRKEIILHQKVGETTTYTKEEFISLLDGLIEERKE
jgi:hypothetical protein